MKKLALLIIALITCFSLTAQQVNSFETSDGTTLYYTKTGEGPTVVLLYGGPGFEAGLMQPWADTLSNSYESILFHQRGTGLSSDVPLNSNTVNLQRAVKDLDDLRKHLGKEKLTLCGVSWGGGLAQAYAAHYPDHTEKIILVSTLGPDLCLMPAFKHNIKMRRYPGEKDSLEYWNHQPDSKEAELKRRKFFFLPYFYDHALGAKVLPGYFAGAQYNSRMAELMWNDLEENYDLKPLLKNYQGECFIIRPRQDPMPAASVFTIQKLIPQTEIHTIEKCGHFPELEKPELLFKILRKVLA